MVDYIIRNTLEQIETEAGITNVNLRDLNTKMDQLPI